MFTYDIILYHSNMFFAFKDCKERKVEKDEKNFFMYKNRKNEGRVKDEK